MAKLYFRYGAMGSGKTAHLLMVAFNYAEKGQRAIIIKPAVDTKGQNKVSTRIGLEKQVDILAWEGDELFELVRARYAYVDCVLVDEAQFFTTAQIEQLRQIVIQLDIPVIAYGLRCDSNQQSRPGSRRLLEIADKIEELKTVCECGNKATLNCRFDKDWQIILGGPQTVIDGADGIVYRSLCPKCRHRYVSNLPH